jgi:predicted small lipoprotein YifL
MMKHSFIAFLLLSLLSGCGLKRPLELPGHEKHVNQNDASPAVNAAPVSAPDSVPLTSSSNPEAVK